MATRRMFGDSASVEVLEDFDACLEAAAADRDTAAMAPAHSKENAGIRGVGGVPLAGMAGPTGPRALAGLELPASHVPAPFGGLGEVTTVVSKGGARAQRPRIIRGCG